MAEGNGSDNTQQRLEQLEQMDKLLLRAQVLQQDALERLERWTAQTEQWMKDHERARAEVNEREKEAKVREKRLDERIDKLVSAIGQLIARIPPENLR